MPRKANAADVLHPEAKGRSGRRRTLAQQAKDALAYDLYCKGLLVREVAERLGMATPSIAHAAIRRGGDDAGKWRLSKDETLAVILHRIHLRYAALQQIIETDFYHVAPGGKVAVHPITGEPLRDAGPAFRALQEQRQLDAMLGQYVDVEPPSKRRVETITRDAVEAQIEELEAELGRRDSPHRRSR